MPKKNTKPLLAPDHLHRMQQYLDTGNYVPRERTEADKGNIYQCLRLAVDGLVGPGSYQARLRNLECMANGWIFGQKHLFNENQQEILRELVLIMKQNGAESGPFRALSEAEYKQCADLWLELLLSAARLLGPDC